MAKSKRLAAGLQPEQADRSWSLNAATVLLFVQGVGLGALAYYAFMTFLPAAMRAPQSVGDFLALLFTNSIAFGCLALLAFAGAVGFLLLWRSAWTLALLLQGLMLLFGLGLYFQAATLYVYVQLFYGIFMVAYLYNPDVRAFFPQTTAVADPEGIP